MVSWGIPAKPITAKHPQVWYPLVTHMVLAKPLRFPFLASALHKVGIIVAIMKFIAWSLRNTWYQSCPLNSVNLSFKYKGFEAYIILWTCCQHDCQIQRKIPIAFIKTRRCHILSSYTCGGHVRMLGLLYLSSSSASASYWSQTDLVGQKLAGPFLLSHIRSSSDLRSWGYAKPKYHAYISFRHQKVV